MFARAAQRSARTLRCSNLRAACRDRRRSSTSSSSNVASSSSTSAEKQLEEEWAGWEFVTRTRSKLSREDVEKGLITQADIEAAWDGVKTSYYMHANDSVRFYPIDMSNLEKIVPEGLGGKLGYVFELMSLTLDPVAIMERAPALSVLSTMEDIKAKGEGHQAFLLRGERGVGKSCTLNHLVHKARSSKEWIVWFMPRGRDLVTKGHYIQKSTHFPNMFDQPRDALLMLKPFRDAHDADLLAAVPIKSEEIIERYAEDDSKAKPVRTLLDLVDRGLSDMEIASTVVVDIRTVLGECTEVPVLIAVDEYNHFFQPSIWSSFPFIKSGERPKEKKVEADRLSLVAPFMEFPASFLTPPPKAPPGGWTAETRPAVPKKLAYGVTVCACSKHHPELSDKKILKFEETWGGVYRPWALFPPRYSQAEFMVALEMYMECGMLGDDTTVNEARKIKMKSGMVPEYVFHKSNDFRI